MSASIPGSNVLPVAAGPSGLARLLAVTAVGVLAIKLAWLLGDPTMRLFMGDSGSYLHSAMTGWKPPDRSFTYGWLLQHSALRFASHWGVLVMQAAFGVAGCLLLTGTLRCLNVRPFWAALAGLALAIEPSQLLYERMLMAESAGTLALVASVTLLMAYAQSGRFEWMVSGTVAGIIAISFRISLLPVILGLAATVPLVAAWRSPERPKRSRVLLHLGATLAVTALIHGGYMQFFRAGDDGKATYLPAEGMMRVGLVAPLIRPEHFHGTGVPASVLAQATPSAADPLNREAQIWSATGLYAQISAHSDDPERVARVVTARALRDAPLRLVEMGLDNAADYFDPLMREPRIQDDLGRRPPDDLMQVDLKQQLGYDAQGVAASDSWVTHWFQAGAGWMVGNLLFLVPLSLLTAALHWRRRTRPAVLVLGLASWGLVASLVLFTHVPSLRYLHPLPWFALAHLALLLGAVWPQAQGSLPAR